MMGLQMILTAFIVSWGLTSGRTNDHMDIKVMSRINDEVEINENFRNLFDSLTKNDFGRREAYRNILEGEATKERDAFDSTKAKFRFARHSNVYKPKNVHASLVKRETHGNDSGTTLETEVKAETTTQQPGTSRRTPKWTKKQFTGVTRITPEFEASTVKDTEYAKFSRQQVRDIFPGENNEDTYTPTLFFNFTKMDPIRVSRRSLRTVRAAIAKPDLRALIREMNIFARRVPFKQLMPDHTWDNRDGLYFRAAFYLLLRAFNYKPTPYFYELMKAHKVISVETDPTVFLYAVNVGVNVDQDFNVTQVLVEGESGKVLPRDNKTIFCVGIHFDTEFAPKIQHFRGVIRDKTLIRDEVKNKCPASPSDDDVEEDEEVKEVKEVGED